MDKEKIQKNNSPFETYKDTVDYDIILNGTIGYKVQSEEDEPVAEPDQLMEGEEEIFKQLNSLMSNEDYLYDVFKDCGITRGCIYGEFSDEKVNEDKLYFTIGISKKDAVKQLDTNEIKEYFEEFLKNLDSDVDLQYVTGWQNEEESVEPTYIELKIEGEPDVQIVKSYVQESNLLDIDRKLVMEGKIDFTNKQNTKSIILNDDGIMELYENNKLIDTQPFSKLGVQRQYKSIIQEGYIIKEQSNINNTQSNIQQDLEQTKQNIEQSIEQVDEIQGLKDELMNKVDNLVNESKLQEEKITKFVSTPFTQKLLNTNEIYDLQPEKELTVEQVAYITKIFGSTDEFKQSLIQLANMASFAPDIHFISIDEYVNEVSKELEEEV